VNVPRAVIAVVHDDAQDDLRHMQVVAGNRVRQAEGRVLRIEGRVLDGLKEEVTRAVWLGDSEKDVSDLLAAAPRRSNSAKARELILDLLDDRGTVESDALDSEIARRTGLAVRTVKDLRLELGRKDGLVRSYPEKDDAGTIKRWLVARTNAPRGGQ
jgi:hypothetical protein